MANNYTTISKKGIEYLCGLINKLANVSEGIDDLNLRTDGTFSSVKIDTLLNTLKTDCNEHTDRLVANLSRLELKIATSESEITQPNTMYLYKPSGSTSYEQYVVIEGTKVLLGTTDINMGDYYTISQTDAKFVLKTDFDSLKTKVDGKVNKTDIVDNLTSTDTNKPLSANQGKVLKDEIDLKANDNEVIKKTDITTTINKNSTDATIPTTLAVRNAMLGMSVSDDTTYGDDVIYFPCGYYRIINNNTAAKLKNLPVSSAGLLQVYSINSHNSDLATGAYTYRMYIFIPIGERDIYVRNISSGDTAGVFTVDTGWQKVCTTKVADVPRTEITFSNTTNYNVVENCLYFVKNGLCTIRLHVKCNTPIDTWVTVANVPKPSIVEFAQHLINTNGSNMLRCIVRTNGSLQLNLGTAGGFYVGSFSYPVAES